MGHVCSIEVVFCNVCFSRLRGECGVSLRCLGGCIYYRGSILQFLLQPAPERVCDVIALFWGMYLLKRVHFAMFASAGSGARVRYHCVVLGGCLYHIGSFLQFLLHRSPERVCDVISLFWVMYLLKRVHFAMFASAVSGARVRYHCVVFGLSLIAISRC